MRTTVRLDQNLFHELKAYAAASGQSITGIITEGIRDILNRTRSGGTRHKPKVRLKTFGSGGVLSGVDLDDSAALLDLMETRK